MNIWEAIELFMEESNPNLAPQSLIKAIKHTAKVLSM